MKLQMKVGVTTSAGKYRNRNEDNYLFHGEYLDSNQDEKSVADKGKIPMLVAVFDGMGGSNYGKEVSTAAAKLLDNYIPELADVDDSAILEELDKLIQKVNLDICSQMGPYKKSGCTLALIYVTINKIYLANVGDSRIYRYTEKELTQLSVDHNQAQDIIRFGLKNGNLDAKKNVLTQYIGMPSSEVIIEPQYRVLDSEKQYFLLCTDGLNDIISKELIDRVIKKYKYNLKKATNFLVSEAIKCGAKDNITAMLIKIY